MRTGDMNTGELLRRNGIIQERAKRAGRSLDKMERSIIMAARDKAYQEGALRHTVNTQEMLGERQFDDVLAPTKVIAVFSNYEDGGSKETMEELGLPIEPTFIVRQSNHPGLVVGGHVGIAQFVDAGLKPPKAMSYEKWVSKGRKAVRK